MNKTSLLSAMCSVESSRTVPVITASIKEANLALDYLSYEFLVKQSNLEALVDGTYFKFYPLHNAHSLEDFQHSFAGFSVPGFIVDANVLDSHPRVMAYLLPHLQSRIRTLPPEKPFNFIFV